MPDEDLKNDLDLKAKVEDDKQEEAAQRKVVGEMMKQLKKAMADRRREENEAQEALQRKAAAEALIKKLNAETLAKAAQISPEAAVKALLSHFILGSGASEYAHLKIRNVNRIGASVLYFGSYVIAVRMEDSPMWPLFLLSQATNMAPREVEILREVEGLLKQYMKPFAYLRYEALVKVADSIGFY